MASKVYFIRASIDDGENLISDKARRLFKAARFADCFKENDFTAVKIHVGEQKNTTYIKPGCIKGLLAELLELKTKPFLTDTSALYTGKRHNAIDHTITASEHGFDVSRLGVPFISADGLFGTSEVAVKIDGKLNKQVFIASDIVMAQSLLSIAHFTGHEATCAAATLKTLGMGCASRKGKMRQHSSIKPYISDNCTGCEQCIELCPVHAISMQESKAHIDPEECIGCGECVAVCRFDAAQYNWGAENEALHRNIAEHALGALKGKEQRAAFFNYLISVTKDCDCVNMADMVNMVDDIGIVASLDPVAVDKAAIDLVESKSSRKMPVLAGNNKLNPLFQIDHAEQIGLGSSHYEIIEID